tara:strand:- start:642 stop:1232 length:591 start_codon:yes stop_codon:yes gene_type:complete
MVERISALSGHYSKGISGKDNRSGIKIHESKNLSLLQISTWSNTLDTVGVKISKHLDLQDYPGPNKAIANEKVGLLRTEPTKWWIVGQEESISHNLSDVANLINDEEGNVLDLSSSRTQIVINGNDSTNLLNRHLPIDLREQSFPIDSLASTAFHHVGVTLWRSKNGYQLFVPRAFALSLWEILIESAHQFGCEVL